MAGAEGFEPSARGFGVDVGKPLRRNAFRLLQRLAGFPLVFLSAFDAFLMLLRLICAGHLLDLAPDKREFF